MKKPDLQSGGCDRSGFSECTPTGLGAYREGHYLAAKKAGLQPGFAFFRTSPISSGLCPSPSNCRPKSLKSSSGTRGVRRPPIACARRKKLRLADVKEM